MFYCTELPIDKRALAQLDKLKSNNTLIDVNPKLQ